MDDYIFGVQGIYQIHMINRSALTSAALNQAAQKQMQQDDDIHGLAVDLRDMLAWADQCPDLSIVKNATDIIREMVRAVLEAASIIDERIVSSFAGTVDSLLPSRYQTLTGECRGGCKGCSLC